MPERVVTSDAWAITDGYVDAVGEWHDTSDEVAAALRHAFEAEGDAPEEPAGLWFVDPGDAAPLWNPADLVLEDGTVLSGVSALPMDLPLGYHWLQPLDGWGPVQIVVTPRRCPPARNRQWGWSAQLYAVRSRRSWGIGDLGDLTELARWTARLGGHSLLINPLHAPPPDLPASPSPYFASSRLMINPLMLAVEDVEGARVHAEDLAPWRSAAMALNDERRIDRHRVWAQKLPALELLFSWQQQQSALREAFDVWHGRQDESLRRWAAFCAISERYGRPWRSWPESLRHPERPEVEAFAAAHLDRVRFHAWLQWQLDRQEAAAAARGVDIIGDLAVGFEPEGFDAWLWQDLLAFGTRIGAPPDPLGPLGQDWGLPPFVPWKVRARRFQPFIETVRANLRHVGGLRIDHVMGLFRIFCIPPGFEATDGAYVRNDSAELLDLLALEATRAGAFVVGEDLGTVESGVRAELSHRGIMGCKVWWFETDPPAHFPMATVASVGTHDLPTVAGVWTGADLAIRQMLGHLAVASANANLDKLERFSPAATNEREVIEEVYSQLAEAGSAIVLASLDDALAVREPPNVPGTIDQWPNWRLALPVGLETIQDDPDVQHLATALEKGRAARVPPPASPVPP